jgi:hypothetical protein
MASKDSIRYQESDPTGPKGATPNTRATMPDTVHPVAASRAPNKPHRTSLEDDTTLPPS